MSRGSWNKFVLNLMAEILVPNILLFKNIYYNTIDLCPRNKKYYLRHTVAKFARRKSEIRGCRAPSSTLTESHSNFHVFETLVEERAHSTDGRGTLFLSFAT